MCVCDCDLIQWKAKSVLHGKAPWVSLFYPRQRSASNSNSRMSCTDARNWTH